MSNNREVLIPYWTKIRRTKFSPPSRKLINCGRFLPDFCTNISGISTYQVFVGQNVCHQVEISSTSSDEFLLDNVVEYLLGDAPVMI